MCISRTQTETIDLLLRLRDALEEWCPCLKEASSSSSATVLSTVQSHLNFCLRELQTWTGKFQEEKLSKVLVQSIPVLLVRSLHAFDFESKKDAVRLFEASMKLFGSAVVGRREDEASCLPLLIEGMSRTDVFFHCSEMLCTCFENAEIVSKLLHHDAPTMFFTLASATVAEANFEVAAEAFSTMRKLLLRHKELTTAYLEAHFQHFFDLFHAAFQVAGYVLQRQLLRLLNEILLDGSFRKIMIKYVADETFLPLHMKLLRDSSSKIRYEAFHTFKIFVYNPRKPRRVQQILHQNKDRLLKALDAFTVFQEADDNFAQDLQKVLDVLQVLGPALRCGQKETFVDVDRKEMPAVV